MQEGRVSFAYKNFLGYKKVDGKIVVDEEEAPLVREIYSSFLKRGMTCTGIAEMLNARNVPTPSKKGKRWTKNTVNSILTNEKYKGDALLQKTYIVDFLEHKPKKNEGEIPQYYVENSHPAIITREEWQMVQTELIRRNDIGAKYSGQSIFSSKLICEDCGGFYGAKVWHSNSKYKRVVYRCNNKYKDKGRTCRTPHFTEEEIKRLFVKAYNLALADKDRLLNDTEEVIVFVKDANDNWSKLIDLLSLQLKTKGQGLNRYSQYFANGIYGLRFECTSTATGSRNKGRLSIDDIVFGTKSGASENSYYITNYGKTSA